VEYKFKLHSKGVPERLWILEHELYTLKQRFAFKYSGPADVHFEVSGAKADPVASKGLFELEMNNVPAFEPEELMPPQGDYKPVVRFYHGPQEGASSFFWSMQATGLSAMFNRIIGENKEIRNAAMEASQSAHEPEEVLRRLYARAQQVRNLSYEHERTEAELKKEELKENKNALDVLKHGYGTREDITIFFVALARAAGFTANVVMTTDRTESLFPRNHSYPGYYESIIAAVRLNSREMYLDPGTRFCPFGLVRWFRTASPALELRGAGGTFFDVPAADQEKAIMLRQAQLTLAPDGKLTGTITVRYEAGEALEHRLMALGSDEAGRKTAMADELKQWLPEGANVALQDSSNWELADQPLLGTFAIEIPNYASVAGKKLVVPTSLFQTRQKTAFQAAERKYPVYFPYAFSEFDVVIIELPEGMAVENFPTAIEAKLPFAEYRNSSKMAENRIVTTRSLLLKQYFFATEKYGSIKDFFGQVKTGDEAHAVLQPLVAAGK